MASKRKLKKVIDSSVFELISDCFTYSEMHQEGKSGNDVSEIINSAVNLRNNLISRVNNPGRETDPKKLKEHYRLIVSDLGEGIDKLCEHLSSLSKKKKK